MLKKLINWYNLIVSKIMKADFVALLLIRLYLLPVIYEGAHSKVLGFSGTVAWFSQSTAQGGLGLPFPWLLAFLATSTEVLGLICIALGLFTRIMAIPMMVVMSVASLMVHWSHGWLAIASNNMESAQRMTAFLQWLMENFPGRYNYITQLGDPIILNNGIEFSATYFIMLLVLLVYGGGKFVSIDYWLKKIRIA
ncbi:DoxX family protein (plasmid) [Klebsiella pneumoniae]|uniref:DoxX family protein n=2 Tax=Enterobacteriaceae TaxID=543 RepID=A0A743GU56_SALER|nr:DoxX family protein [Klebsiella pneumoniae]HAF1690106.1 DoxX family protein [Salmonella enterica]HBV9912675.1 DoxX family protein [Klebsiella aerogenes]MBS8179452.1 DoxX family protein [Klebsiella pneumoniae]MBT1552496.1 DoxX family protein [Klebsiella pneumoniae]MBT1663603.1 DoxX family protein [Klebsiella pneumoniae]